MTALRVRQLDEAIPGVRDRNGRSRQRGLTAFGPYSLRLGARHPNQVRLGIVGPAPGHREGAQVPRSNAGQPSTLGNMQLQRPPFPDFGSTFESQLLVGDTWRYTIRDRDIAAALELHPPKAFRELLACGPPASSNFECIWIRRLTSSCAPSRTRCWSTAAESASPTPREALRAAEPLDEPPDTVKLPGRERARGALDSAADVYSMCTHGAEGQDAQRSGEPPAAKHV